MKKLIYTTTLLSFLNACKEPINRESNTASENSTPTNITQDSVSIVNNPINNLNVQTSTFTEIDSSGILMFPLTMGESKGSGDRLLYKDMPESNYWNIAFYNSKTAEYNLLSEKKMLIKNYVTKNSEEFTNTFSKKYISYDIIADDTNGDKFYSDDDATYLFVSDKAGKNFKQISPSNYDLLNWEYVSSSNKIIMRLKKDSDKNKIFDDKDEVTSFIFDVEKGTEATEVFPTDFKNKLKVLYDRDWKRVKK